MGGLTITTKTRKRLTQIAMVEHTSSTTSTQFVTLGGGDHPSSEYINVGGGNALLSKRSETDQVNPSPTVSYSEENPSPVQLQERQVFVDEEEERRETEVTESPVMVREEQSLQPAQEDYRTETVPPQQFIPQTSHVIISERPAMDTMQQGVSPFIQQLFSNVNKAIVTEKITDNALLRRFNSKDLFMVELSNYSNGINLIAREKRGRSFSHFYNQNMPFTLIVSFYNNQTEQTDVLRIRYPKKSLFASKSLTVMNDQKQLIGTISKKFSLTTRKLAIMDKDNNVLFTLKARNQMGTSVFKIYRQKAVVGQISKGFEQHWWTDSAPQFITDPSQRRAVENVYSIQFPTEATPFEGALILSCVFLIDLVYFDQQY